MVVKKYFLIFVFLLIVLISGLFLIAIKSDFDVENYKYFKEISLSNLSSSSPPICQTGSCLSYFEIDEEIYLGSVLFLADLKVIRSDGREISYMVGKDEDVLIHEIEDREVRILNPTSPEASKGRQEYILDLGEIKEFHNKLRVISDSEDYHRKVSIFGSGQADGSFEKLNLNADTLETFSSAPGNQDLFIEYKFNNYRYLKLIISDVSGDFVLQEFLQIFDRVSTQKGDRRFSEVKIEDITTETEGVFLLDLEKQGVLVEKLNLNFLESNFSRNYILYSSNDKNAQDWKKLSDGEIFKTPYQEELAIDAFDNKRFYKLAIEDKNDIKLHLVSANFESFIQKIYFIDDLNFDKYSYRLYYGATGIENRNNKEFLASKNIGDTLLVLGYQNENKSFKKQILSENIFLQKWYYFFILAIFFIILWFATKIFWEKKHKNRKEKKDNFISKL